MNEQIRQMIQAMTSMMVVGMGFGMARPIMFQSLPLDTGLKSAITDGDFFHARIRGLRTHLTSEEVEKYPMLSDYLNKALISSAEACARLEMARSYVHRIEKTGKEGP